MDIFRFTPSYDERIWGGRALKEHFGRILPKGIRIGESKEIFDFGDISSIISNGAHKGEYFHNILQKYPNEIMGPNWNIGAKFPIIIKLLDARQTLSLQVHPNNIAEKLYGDKKKNEAWYFLKCGINAYFISGFNKKITKEELISHKMEGQLKSVLKYHQAHNGDFIFIEAGTVHALGADNVVLEIQENSESVYRIDDWDRVDSSGKPRELHTEKALNSINFDSSSATLIQENNTKEIKLCTNKKFEIIRIKLSAGESLKFADGEIPRLISIISGRMSYEFGELKSVETILIPYCKKISFTAIEDSIILITEKFTQT